MNSIRSLGMMVCAAALSAACGGKAASDADRPAVVKAPPIVLPSDTAKPDTTAEHIEKMDKLNRQLSEIHGFMGAMVVIGDRRMLSQYYDANATVRLVDSTFHGVVNIANGLTQLARQQSFKEIVRKPVNLRATDSTVIDSGVYGILSQREGGTPRDLRGSYVTHWRKGPTPQIGWIVVGDTVLPGKLQKTPAVPSTPGRKAH